MALPPIGNTELQTVLSALAPVQAISLAEIAPEELGAEHLESIGNALMTMQETEFTAPFDWMSEFGDRREVLEDPAYLAKTDLEELRKIITAHIRIDRMDFGHLHGLIASGYWNQAVQRLQELAGEQPG